MLSLQRRWDRNGPLLCNCKRFRQLKRAVRREGWPKDAPTNSKGALSRYVEGVGPRGGRPHANTDGLLSCLTSRGPASYFAKTLRCLLRATRIEIGVNRVGNTLRGHISRRGPLMRLTRATSERLRCKAWLLEPVAKMRRPLDGRLSLAALAASLGDRRGGNVGPKKRGR